MEVLPNRAAPEGLGTENDLPTTDTDTLPLEGPLDVAGMTETSLMIALECTTRKLADRNPTDVAILSEFVYPEGTFAVTDEQLIHKVES